MLFHTNEFVSDSTKEVLYNEEIFQHQFKTTIQGKKRNIWIPAEIRHQAKIEENDYVVISIKYLDEQIRFVQKVRHWGRVPIPKRDMHELKLSSGTIRVSVQIIKAERTYKKINAFSIDLVKVLENNKTNVIERGKEHITIIWPSGKPLTLNRTVTLSPDLIECLYLIHGDGHYKSKLFFTNINPELHQFVIAEFEKVGIERVLWKARINHNSRDKLEASQKFWKDALQFNNNQFYVTGKLSPFKTQEKGDLRIILESRIVGFMVRRLIETIPLLDKRNNLIALNGILAAEGSVGLGERGSTHKITIAHNAAEKEMFIQLLVNSEIEHVCDKKKDKIYIRGWENLYKFLKSFLDSDLIPFDKHTKRKKSFLTSFLLHSFTKTLYKYLSALDKRALTQTELARDMNHRRDSVHDTLKKPRYKRFIDRKDKKYYITPEGEEFLKVIKKLQKHCSLIEPEQKAEGDSTCNYHLNNLIEVY